MPVYLIFYISYLVLSIVLTIIHTYLHEGNLRLPIRSPNNLHKHCDPRSFRCLLASILRLLFHSWYPYVQLVLTTSLLRSLFHGHFTRFLIFLRTFTYLCSRLGTRLANTRRFRNIQDTLSRLTINTVG